MMYVARVCERCGKPRGTMAFRYKKADGISARGYFHPACFQKLLAELDQIK